jgi:exopolyphosphatase/guanosine-5'-triphosphate,3'-diphosphate pyrophosphatase
VEGPKGHNGGHTVPTAAPGHATGSADLRGLPPAASVTPETLGHGAPPALPLNGNPAPAQQPHQPRPHDAHRHQRNTPAEKVYAALDLGTNNCRLLVARPSRRGFKVIDAFSRIIRLGEGVSITGRLSDEAMMRTIDALQVCANKIKRHQVARARLVATEACRLAGNAPEFLDKVRRATGLTIEIVSQETEARLAVSGCSSLVDMSSDFALVFDIGGGSSELIWLDLRRRRNQRRGPHDRLDVQGCVVAWTSLPVGVVTLAERFGGQFVDRELFNGMVCHVARLLAPFEAKHSLRAQIDAAQTHLLGTSGTVTTLAGVHMGLPRYERAKVDGYWLETPQVRAVTELLLDATYEERIAQPCIGRERADLVLAGCAILEAVLQMWPCPRLRVADRGLREGILTTLMAEDGAHRVSGRPGFWRR